MIKKPTVTELLKLLDKPALIKWANKLGLDGKSLDDFYAEKRAEGTSLHKQVQQYIQSNIRMKDAAQQSSLDKFLLTRRVLGVEKPIETEWFVGRYDIAFKIDEQVYVGDFKSSDKVYFENKLQLAAYQMVFPGAKICVIHIPLFTVDIIREDLTKYQEIIKLLSRIYTLKGEIENESN